MQPPGSRPPTSRCAYCIAGTGSPVAVRGRTLDSVELDVGEEAEA